MNCMQQPVLAPLAVRLFIKSEEVSNQMPTTDPVADPSLVEGWEEIDRTIAKGWRLHDRSASRFGDCDEIQNQSQE